MKITKYIAVGAALMVLQTSAAHAEVSEKLVHFIQHHIGAFNNAMESCDAEEDTAGLMSSTDSYYFRRVWLRVRPKGGISVPHIAKFEVQPEIEVLFERTLPDGWKTYKR